ncbi:hypothetical protein DFJ74DRAFT_434859 [Hyaloraphidium curvatum]|nr:hypothetical protein DFJ74DRAFT_434859 [Hyaloraphidium curvatum]
MGDAPVFAAAAFPSLGSRPHVLAAGSALASTALSLAGASCPPKLRSLTATEAALKLLADRAAWGLLADKKAVCAAAAPTADAVAAMTLLSDPAARKNARLLVDVARGGLLGAFASRAAARASFALARAAADALKDDPTVALVPLLGRIAADPASGKPLYEAEDALYASTLDAIKSGVISLRLVDSLDLAFVQIDPRVGEYHPAAVRSEIAYPGSAAAGGDAPHPDSDPVASRHPGRVLTWHPPECSFEYTPLSTVRLLADPDGAPRQHDLRPLADALNAYERKAPAGPGGTTFWTLDKDGKGLRCRGSGLKWELVRDAVERFYSDKAAATHSPWAGLTGNKAI